MADKNLTQTRKELFDLMANEFSTVMVESELDEIIRCCNPNLFPSVGDTLDANGSLHIGDVSEPFYCPACDDGRDLNIGEDCEECGYGA